MEVVRVQPRAHERGVIPAGQQTAGAGTASLPARDNHDILSAITRALLRDEHRLQLACYARALADSIVPEAIVRGQTLALLIYKVSLFRRFSDVLRCRERSLE